MQSKAATVDEYLASLPADRRAAISAVREVILANLDEDYEEGMQYGMIGYYVPHRVFAAGYHCDASQPLPFAAPQASRNHFTTRIVLASRHSLHRQDFGSRGRATQGWNRSAGGSGPALKEAHQEDDGVREVRFAVPVHLPCRRAGRG